MVPSDGEKRHGVVELSLMDSGIKVHSKVVASACEGHGEWAHLSQTTLQVLNVVPTNGELLIRISINGIPINYRVHVIAFN